MLHSKRLGSRFVLDTWRVLPQRRITRHLTQKHGLERPVIRKHVVQPSTDKHAKNYEKALRTHWEAPAKKSKLLRPKLANGSQDPPPYYYEPARHDISPTQQWLTSIGSVVNMIPKNLSQVEFPAGDVVAFPPSSGPTPKRTQEDKQKVEAVLEIRISHLAKYVSPEMMESIKVSPYYARYKNAVLLRCHQHQSQGANQRQCYKNLNRLVRNVAREIVYREEKIVVDEMAYRGEADIEDSQPMILTKAESQAVAWNLQKSFTLQIKELRKAAKKGQENAERAENSSVLASPNEEKQDRKERTLMLR